MARLKGNAMTLPKQQRAVAGFIAASLRKTGTPPSYAEIRNAFGYQDNTGVRKVIIRLEAKGVIKRYGQGRQRRIKLVRVR
jgi:SOS-response transcriptional repressor LexA